MTKEGKKSCNHYKIVTDDDEFDRTGLGSYHSHPWRHANVPLEVLVNDGPDVSALFGHSLQVSGGIDKAAAANSARATIATLRMQHARVVGRCR